jgi:hypothetical protein
MADINTKEREISSRVSREDQTRDAFIRRNIINQGNGRFDVDPSRIPEGFQYRWGRDTCMDKPDMNRIPELLSTGWSIVPAERHPERRNFDIPGRERDTDGCVREGGQILMERRKEYCELEEQEHTKLVERQVSGVPVQKGFGYHPSMPTKVYSHRTERRVE